MRVQFGRHIASAASNRKKNTALFRLCCRLSILKLLLLFGIIVLLLLIAFHVNSKTDVSILPVGYQKEVYIRRSAHVASTRIGIRYRKGDKTTANIQAHHNINPNSEKYIKNNINERPKIKTTETLQDKEHCLSWCQKKTTSNDLYFLSAVLLVRIYSSDLAKLSTRELIQWLYYLSYAGFEHVYVYDAYVFKNESQKDALDFFIKQGFVTYVDWSHNAFPYTVTKTQESAYQDCLNKWGNLSSWQASIDIDEYPFCPQDTKPNFMQRFITNFSEQRPDVSQITMQNFLFLGKPLDDRQHPLLIDRLKRRTHGPANALVKPIYKTEDVSITHVHHHDLKKGKSEDADFYRIRLNHYWGARLQNWGEDTAEILVKTREDITMEDIVKNLAQCIEVCLPGESLIYKFRWN